MPEALPIHESRLKHFATVIASTAALLTSMAALLEACDKSTEKQSYEVLAQKIVELQEAQAQPPPADYQNDMFIPTAEPSAASAPSGSPAASSAPLAVRSQPKSNPSPPPPMARPAPPPAWKDAVSKPF